MQYGIGVPKGGVATTAAEAEQVAKDIGMRLHERAGTLGTDLMQAEKMRS